MVGHEAVATKSAVALADEPFAEIASLDVEAQALAPTSSGMSSASVLTVARTVGAL